MRGSLVRPARAKLGRLVNNEPTRFPFYASHALQRVCNGVGEEAIDLILEASLSLPRTIVSTLINDVTAFADSSEDSERHFFPAAACAIEFVIWC